MSGLEVVGVVLGSIPLVIEALKFYRDGIETVYNMFKYLDTFDMIYVEFSTTLSRFLQECEHLYRKELELPDHQYKEFMENGGEKWEGSFHVEFEQRLRGKLGHDWQAYMDLSKYLKKRFGILKKKLDLNEDFSVPFVDGCGPSKILNKSKCAEFFTIARRIKGGLRKGHLRILVSEIGHDVEKLGKLTRCAIELEPIRHQHRDQDKSKSISKYWLSAHSYTMQVYHALCCSWPQSCASLHRHCAQLRIDLPNRNCPADELPSFAFSFSLEGNGIPQTTLPWEKRDVRMISLPEPDHAISSPKVRFSVPKVTVDPTHQAPKIFCQSVHEVHDLCSVLGKPCSNSSCLGSFVHEERRYHVHEEENKCPGRLKRLQQIFSRQSRRGLRPNERTAIAFGLASAVLQLHDTPWLNENWDLDDLYFRPSGSSYELVVVETFGDVSLHPCLPQPGKRDYGPFIKNKTVYSLGVALLELANGQPLTQCQTDEDLNDEGSSDALTPYRTVDRLLRELQEDEKESNFMLAVDYCLNPRADGRGPGSGSMAFSLTNEKFRQCFFDDVVVRLQEDYEAVFSADGK